MRYPKKAFAACVLTAVLGLLVWSDSNPALAQGLPYQIANPYPVLNPNYVPSPYVATPIIPGPIVPSPVVPTLNVTPNGWTPGYPVIQPILPPPPFVTLPIGGPIIIVGR